MIFQKTIDIETAGHGDMHDITDNVASILSQSHIQFGVVHVFNIGSTATIGTIEFEPGLRSDMPDLLDRLIPPSASYGHEQTWHDGNGHSHLQATWMGPGLTVPISKGNMALGTWQQVFHLECDVRSRRRKIVVTVMGD